MRYNFYYGKGDQVTFQTGFTTQPTNVYYFNSVSPSGVNSTVNLSNNQSGVKSAWESWTNKLNANIAQMRQAAINLVAEQRGNLVLPSDAPDINSINGKILHIKNGDIYYRIKVKQESFYNQIYNIPSNATLRNTYLDTIFSHPADNPIYGNDPGTSPYNIAGTDIFMYSYSTDAWSLQAYGYDFSIELEQLQENIAVDVTNNGDRYHLSDSPYDMFCLPYSDVATIYNGTPKLVPQTSKFSSLFIAQQIALSSGSGNIYDIQLLPYCPVRQVLKNGVIDVSGTKYETVYTGDLAEDGKSLIDNANKKPVSVLLWANKSDFSFDIDVGIPAEQNPLLKKVKNLTQMYRLCSPNYNGMFEFNVQKNNGLLKVNVDCTYKPFNPYIHVNPDFGGLYGKDWNDARGLICGGDYSIAQTTSAWAEYELNNKNYQAMFDRGIQNMEVNNAVQREKEKWQMAAGVMNAYASGKQAGDSTVLGLGGLFGVGNITGAASAGFSYAAGKRDIELNDQLRNETLDYTKDMYGYQLGNIKALPQSIAKTAANNANNKLIPFLEKYDCDIVDTNYQREALINKLRYNGMTIMRIGTVGDFRTPWSYVDDEGNTVTQDLVYVKGKLIRIDGLNEDYHISKALAEEINKGVFI